jgi:rhodanese-related sulfurtransferase
VRGRLEFKSERIDGAWLIPLDQLDIRLDELPEDADVVVVCRTGVRVTFAAEVLARAGRRARVLEGGLNAWRRARLPVREGRKRLAVDRQVQLIAGLTVFRSGTGRQIWWPGTSPQGQDPPRFVRFATWLRPRL